VFITAGADVREFDVTDLRIEPFYLVCQPSHRLAGKRGVTLAQLNGEDVIQLARSSSVRQQLEAVGAAAQPNALEVEHLATVAALVAQGLGVSIVPELALFHFERAGLCCVPVRDRVLRRPIILARRKDKALSVAAKAMVEEILTEARQ
jgi:DNA-binding transcriptional LysR family regulator